MDLRSMLNTEGGSALKPQLQHPPPPPLPPSQVQQHQPSTPVTAVPPHPFREYGQSSQASPGRQYSHEYGAQPAPTSAGHYAGSPPPAYPAPVAPAAPGPYGPRPAPPPLQPLSSDMRSPSTASAHRPTPTSSISNASGGYFPAQGTPLSPVQRHSYPQNVAYPPRESFSQQAPAGAPVGMTGPAGAPPYMQGAPIPPQTPPVVTQGGMNPYPHQRSQSTHSTPTPTSAQSQHQYGAPYAQGSPVPAHHQLPSADHPRQPSQPPTPLGPPLSAGPRPSQGPGSFGQPPSPYQQRVSSSTGSYHHPPTQSSPPPPPPPSIPRMPSSQNIYDQHPDAHRRSQSQSDRDRSLSVSPKTRIPSLPSSTGHPTSAADSEPRHLPPNSIVAMEVERDRAVTPAKRKLDDRDLRADELVRQETRPPPFAEVNGSHISSQPPPPPRTQRMSTSPVMRRKRRPFHMTEPIWAQRSGNRRLNNPNFVLRKVQHPHVNGKQESVPKTERGSRHASPEAARSTGAPAQPPAEEPKASLLGAWEPSFTGQRPYEEISKAVADWLFCNVVESPDMGEITSRGVQFEIEAKLGTIISRDTNNRIDLPVLSECLLRDDGRIAFRSSMTESQHKLFNDYLNNTVVETDPRNPAAAARGRVQIHYEHRREIDKFYELPPALQDRLPACVRNRLPPKRGGRVRVTYDQKTHKLLAKIVKVRVADMSMHFPNATLDCRISINLEMPWDGAVEELESAGAAANANPDKMPDRNKDRLSYRQSHYQVDVTQVTQLVPGPNNTQRLEKEHELEVELKPGVLIEQGQRAFRGEPHQYQELVEGLMDNVRNLVRRADETPRRTH